MIKKLAQEQALRKDFTMEEFGYNKRFKVSKFMGAGYPMLGLLGLIAQWAIAYWVFEVENPHRSTSVEFKWWAPLLAVGLIVWAIFEIKKGREVSRFKVRLAKDIIQVGDQRILWTDIDHVEFKPVAFGQHPAAIIHASDGRVLKIPAAIESYPYIQGVIESHTTERSVA